MPFSSGKRDHDLEPAPEPSTEANGTDAHPAGSEESAREHGDALSDAVLGVLDHTSVVHAATTAPSTAFGALGLARIVDLRGAVVDVSVGGKVVEASASPTLHVAVMKTAMESGDLVLVERSPDGSLMVVGALRTRPTPGVDEMQEVTIEADRISLRGRKEILLSTSGVAQLALRAAGEIEIYADRIVSRAEELHKIVGRMLRLN